MFDQFFINLSININMDSRNRFGTTVPPNKGENVVQAYKRIVEHLIIVISGLPGTHKTALANKIADRFELKHVNMHHYGVKDFTNETKLANDQTTTNYYTNDAI